MPEPTTDERITVDACPKCGAREYDPPRDCEFCESGGHLVPVAYVPESVVDALREENARLKERIERPGPPGGRTCDECGANRWDQKQVHGWIETARRERDEARRATDAACQERAVLRARVEELERECDRLRSGVRDIAREFGMYETDDRTAGEAFSMAHALLFGGSQEPRPDVSPLHAAALRSRARAGLASPEPRPEPRCSTCDDTGMTDNPTGDGPALVGCQDCPEEPRPVAICECCENPTTRPYVHPEEGIDLCAPCVAALPREEWTPKEEQT